jgi:hypothetical protein
MGKKQVLRCAQNDMQKNKGNGKSKSNGKCKSNDKG